MEILEEFNNPLFNTITIFHLLTHTSGLRPDPGAYFEPYQNSWDWYEKENWIEEILRGHTRVEPGKEWSYSSASYTILGEIVTRVSGLKYEEYVRENILKPLDMNDSFFEIPAEKIHLICLNNDETEDVNRWLEEYRNAPEWFPPDSGGGLFSTLKD